MTSAMMSACTQRLAACTLQAVCTCGWYRDAGTELSGLVGRGKPCRTLFAGEGVGQADERVVRTRRVECPLCMHPQPSTP